MFRHQSNILREFNKTKNRASNIDFIDAQQEQDTNNFKNIKEKFCRTNAATMYVLNLRLFLINSLRMAP